MAGLNRNDLKEFRRQLESEQRLRAEGSPVRVSLKKFAHVGSGLNTAADTLITTKMTPIFAQVLMEMHFISVDIRGGNVPEISKACLARGSGIVRSCTVIPRTEHITQRCTKRGSVLISSYANKHATKTRS